MFKYIANKERGRARLANVSYFGGFQKPHRVLRFGGDSGFGKRHVHFFTRNVPILEMSRTFINFHQKNHCRLHMDIELLVFTERILYI